MAQSTSATIAATLRTDRAKLNGPYRVQPHQALGEETPLSQECYRRLLRYVRLTQPRLKEWSRHPGCRYHKADNHQEWAVRQNSTVALGYSALLAGDYDADVAGVPREKIRDDLIALLCYLAITHKANFLPTGDGEPWGDHWQSALWAHWAGRAAWLAWDQLDDDLRVMLARMIIHEANRFNTRPPDSGFRGDTKAEENAWNSMVIALADCMFPHHPNADLWHERAIVYMLNAFTRESDMKETKIVDGRPVKDRVTAVTLHPDFTLENHNRVHPDYMGCIGLNLRNVLLYRAAAREAPESAFYNAAEIWSRLKPLIATNGSLFYVNGQDWWPHRHDVPLAISSLMSVLYDDREAAFLERSTLDFFERMHARFGDGRAWNPREYNYRNAEEEMIASYAELYLLHRLAGDGPTALTHTQFLARQSGVYHCERGNFIFHRTPDKFVSFAWGCGAMGLIYPSDDTWFTAPSERGLVGHIRCERISDDQPRVEEWNVRHQGETLYTRGASPVHGKPLKPRPQFAFAGRIARCEDTVDQQVALASLASGPVVYMERLVARKDLRVNEVATGLIGILNEDAPGIVPNRRIIYHAEGTEEVVGRADRPARLLQWKTRWANVDGKLGVLSSGNTIAYRDNNAYEHARLEEELIANYRTGVGAVKAGDAFSTCIVVCVPNQAPEATRAMDMAFLRPADTVLEVHVDEAVIIANIGLEKRTVESFDSITLHPCTCVILGE